jgi:short-subunit dehydrogenase
MTESSTIKTPRWQSAWITGASQGIGRALAQELARSCAAVAISARDAQVLAELEATQSRLAAYPLDVADTAATSTTINAIEAAQGPIDLAILSAGTYQPLPGGVGDPALFRRHMEVNYMGVVNALMVLLPKMQQRGRGQIAIMGSVAGYRGLPQAAAYGPTKAALISLAETLRLELDGSGVDIRLINPGFVATRLTAKNDFDMPAIMTPEQAAERILHGLNGSAFEISFPRRFVAWLKFGRLLPYRLWFPLARRMVK